MLMHNICDRCTVRICTQRVLSRSVVFDSAMPWIVVLQAPLSMGFSRQDYCNGLPFPTPWDLPHLGIAPMSLRSPALAGRFFTTTAPGRPRHARVA